MNGIIQLPQWNRPGVPGPSQSPWIGTGGQQALAREQQNIGDTVQGAIGAIGNAFINADRTKKQRASALLGTGMTALKQWQADAEVQYNANPIQAQAGEADTEDSRYTGPGAVPYYYASTKDWRKNRQSTIDSIAEKIDDQEAKQQFLDFANMTADVDQKKIMMIDEAHTTGLVAKATMENIKKAVDLNDLDTVKGVISGAVGSGLFTQARGEEIARAADVQIGIKTLKDTIVGIAQADLNAAVKAIDAQRGIKLPSGGIEPLGDSMKAELVKVASDASTAAKKAAKDATDKYNDEFSRVGYDQIKGGKIQSQAQLNQLMAQDKQLTFETKKRLSDLLESELKGEKDKRTPDQERALADALEFISRPDTTKTQGQEKLTALFPRLQAEDRFSLTQKNDNKILYPELAGVDTVLKNAADSANKDKEKAERAYLDAKVYFWKNVDGELREAQKKNGKTPLAPQQVKDIVDRVLRSATIAPTLKPPSVGDFFAKSPGSDFFKAMLFKKQFPTHQMTAPQEQEAVDKAIPAATEMLRQIYEYAIPASDVSAVWGGSGNIQMEVRNLRGQKSTRLVFKIDDQDKEIQLFREEIRRDGSRRWVDALDELGAAKAAKFRAEFKTGRIEGLIDTGAPAGSQLGGRGWD